MLTCQRRRHSWHWPILSSALVAWCVAAEAGQSNSLMDISADGRLLACANRDAGSVTIIDVASFTKTGEVAVGAHPEGVSFIGGTAQVAVAVYDEDRVVFVDADSRTVIATIDVFDEPYGIVSDAAGETLYVTLDYPGQVVEIDVASRRVGRSFDVGAHLRGAALSEADRRLLVTEYYTGIVKAVDIASGVVVDEWVGLSTDNLARQVALHPQRPKAYLPHIRSKITAVHGEGSIFPYVTVIDTDSRTTEAGGAGEGSDGRRPRRKRIPMDSFVGARVTSNPWEVAVSPDGKRLCVLFSGTDDMYVCDVLDDNYREIAFRGSVQLGHNPRAARFAPDGEAIYVYNALDFELAAYGAERLQRIAAVTTCENPLGEQVLLGKRLFYSALQPMASRRWIACSSCHPDSQSDGRTWHNPEGLRNTQALPGLAWTHPLHWSADRDEVQDFEHTIRGKLMQGRGLLRGGLDAELGAPLKGRSAELDALAAYTNTHEFSLSPHAKAGLSDAAERGRSLFFNRETKCAECHSGPFYTDSRPDREIVRHDVGTGRADTGEKMGYAYDTPTLLGVYRTAPYLHDGSAATLADVLTTQNVEDRHGRTSQLTAGQVADLVEFLKALPYEDPAAAGRAEGLRETRE
jgi:YVTN family beta-propeller protein